MGVCVRFCGCVLLLVKTDIQVYTCTCFMKIVVLGISLFGCPWSNRYVDKRNWRNWLHYCTIPIYMYTCTVAHAGCCAKHIITTCALPVATTTRVHVPSTIISSRPEIESLASLASKRSQSQAAERFESHYTTYQRPFITENGKAVTNSITQSASQLLKAAVFIGAKCCNCKTEYKKHVNSLSADWQLDWHAATPPPLSRHACSTDATQHDHTTTVTELSTEFAQRSRHLRYCNMLYI